MTEEAQPPGVERAADGSPDGPTGHQPRYYEPSYTLPADSSEGAPAGAAGQPGGPVSEWSRPAPAGFGDEPEHPTVAWGAGSSGPAPVPAYAPLTSTPGPGLAPDPLAPSPGPVVAGRSPSGSVVGTPYPLRTVPGGPQFQSAPGMATTPAYPGTTVPMGGPGGAGGGRPASVPAPPRESLRAPRRVDAVPGTPFGLVYLDVAPVTSGPAVAALVTGVGSVLVAFVGGCLGILGGEGGWGGWAAGAFAVLAGLLGLAGVLLGELGRRQTGPAGSTGWLGRSGGGGVPATGAAPPVRFTGRGLAIAGITCGGVGLALTLLAVAVAVLLQVA